MNAFFRNNTVLRVVALLFAFILWLTVSAQNNAPINSTAATSVVQKFPFQIHVQVGSNLVLAGTSQNAAVVVVNTSIIDSAALPTKMLNVELVANAKGLGPGQHVVQLAAMGMPSANYSIQPSTVTVDIEAKISEQRTVTVHTTGKTAAGYSAGDASVDVGDVTISGSAKAVHQVTAVVANVSVEGATKALNRTTTLVPVDAYGHEVQGVDVSPSAATVTVPLTTAKEMFSLSPQIVGTPASGYAVSGVTVSPGNIEVLGASGNVAPTSGWSIPVSVAGISKTQTMTVLVPTLAGERAVPSQVRATVTVEPSASRTFTQVPIVVTDLNAGEKVTLTKVQEISVTVVGPSSIINGMTAADIQVFLVGSQLTSSNTSAALDVVLPQWVSASALSANQVPVQVTASGSAQ